MGKTAKNPMSEDELFSALGLSAVAAEPKERRSTPQINADLLIDILAPESDAAKRSSADAARERAREEQEREMRLRSQEWKRELEQQQMRDAAMAAAAEQERVAREEESTRAKAQPIIPNATEMRDIEDVASMAEAKRRAADEVERRRLAMQAQVRRRQEEVAAEAQAAAEAARKRAQEQEGAQQIAGGQPMTQRSASSRQERQTKSIRPDSSRPLQLEQSRRPQPMRGETSQRVQSIPPNFEPKRQVRAGQPPRSVGRPQQHPMGHSLELQNKSAGDARLSADTMRQRPQGYSQNLGDSAPIANAPRPEITVDNQPMSQSLPPQAPPVSSVQVEGSQRKNASRREMHGDSQSKESPLGIVLIVLAVLCVLVAASLLTGLWDISNL